MSRVIKHVEIEVVGHEKPFVFDIPIQAWHAFQSELARSPGAAANNLVLNTSTERERLKAIVEDDWGFATGLAARIADEIAPGIQALVKKPSPSVTN